METSGAFFITSRINQTMRPGIASPARAYAALYA